MAISQAKIERIQSERQRYERRIVDIEADTIFELAMQLNLEEATVQRIWEGAI